MNSDIHPVRLNRANRLCLRVEFACGRMVDGNTTLAEIASDAGFSDQPHFSRTFKQETGLTPAEYRAGMR